MSRQEYDVEALELSDDDFVETGPGVLLERNAAPRRWQTEMRHRPRRSANSQTRAGAHQRRRKHFDC